jgi:hypothetical protein
MRIGGKVAIRWLTDSAQWERAAHRGSAMSASVGGALVVLAATVAMAGPMRSAQRPQPPLAVPTPVLSTSFG